MPIVYEGGNTPPEPPKEEHKTPFKKPPTLPEMYRQKQQALFTPTLPPTVQQPDRRVGDRIKGWDHTTMADHPQVTAFVVGRSGMNDREARNFGRGFKMAADYVAREEQFANTNNYLAPLRRKVMGINDPAVRRQGQIFLDNLAAMTPERQQALLAMLQSTNARGRSSGHTYTAEDVALLGEAAPNQAVTGGVGDEYQGTATGFELKGGTSQSVDFYVALKSLFPEVALHINEDAGYSLENAFDDIATAQENTADYIYNSSGGVRGGVDVLDEFQQGKRSAAGTFLPLIGAITSAPSEVSFKVMGDAGRSTSYTENFTNQVDAGFAQIQEEMSKHIEPIMAVGLGSPDPNSPDYNPDYEETLRQRMGALALLSVLAPIAVGKITGKIKIVRSAVTPDAAKAALEAHYRVPKTDPAFLDKVLSAARAPARVAGEAIDKQILKLARDPEAFFTAALHGRGGRRLLDNIEAAQKAFPDDVDGQVGFILEVYGDQVPAGFARQLVTAGSREGAQRVFIDTVSRAPGRKAIGELNRKATAAEAAIKEQADKIENTRRNGVPPEGSVGDMPMRTVDNFADPELWDPNTQMVHGGRGKLTGDQYQALAEDIQANGIREPLDIHVNPETGQAIMGEGFHRWLVAHDLGLESVPVRIVYDSSVVGKGLTPLGKEVTDLERQLDGLVARRLEGGETGGLNETAVVGPDGEPLRVFHGTTEAYDTPSEELFSDNSAYGPGFYTTENPGVAGGYAGARPTIAGTEEAADSLIRFYGGGRKTQMPNGQWEVSALRESLGSPNLRPTYLNIKKPFRVDAELDYDLLDQIDAMLEQNYGADMAGNFRFQFDAYRTTSLNSGTNDVIYQALDDAFNGDRAAVNHLLEQSGFDGITHIGGTGNGPGTVPHRVWIAFHSEQVLPGIRRSTLQEILDTEAKLATAKAALRDANPVISAGDLQELARRRMELDDINYKISTTFDENPMLTLPNQSTLRSIVRQPTTAFQHAMATILQKSHFLGKNQLLDLAKSVDELATRPELFVPGSADNPLDFIEQNNGVLSNYMRRAGVDSQTIQRRLGSMANAKTDVEFYQILEHEIFGEGGDIDIALKGAKLDPELRKQLINVHDNPVETRTRSMLFDGVETPAGKGTATTHVLGREVAPGQTIPTPSRPSEFLDRVSLPSVDKVIEANSFIRRAAQSARKNRLTSPAAKAFWDIPRAALHVSTLLAKPLIMITRLPAMAMRIQMEQGLRSAAFGYKAFKGFPAGLSMLPGGIPIPGINHRILGGLFGEDGWRLLAPDPRFEGLSKAASNSEMGMFMEIADTPKSERVLESTADLNARRTTPKTRHYEAVREELDLIHTDWLDREIARKLHDNPNLDPQEIMDWLTSDAARNEWLTTHMDRGLEGSTLWSGDLDAARTAWMQNRISYVKQATGMDPDLLHVAAHGRLPGAVEPPIEAQLRYRNAVREVTETGDEIKRIKREEPDSPEKDANLAALYAERKAEWARQRELARQYPGIDGTKKPRKTAKGASHAKREIRAKIAEKYDAGTYNFPDRIQTARRFEQSQEGATLWEDLDRYTQGVSSTMYRGMKPLTYIDRHGTRGSLFTQSQARWKKRLEDFGYTEKEAASIAYVKAGKETRDLMYDLNGRTSLQRALKDIFWFAPATQEVLYTWLVKIPSQQYWPVGIASLGAKVVIVKELLKQTGLVQEDAQGNEVIVVKPVARLLDALLPGEVPEFAYGKLSGLNLVTTGGGVPGLSIPANFALGKAALKFGGPFKALSDVFQPYGPEAAILPQPITFLHEAVFGEPPPWEFSAPDYLKAQWDRTKDMGIQYAYADLQSRGITPPHPEDYGTYNKTEDRWILTSQQEEAFKTANKAYLDQLFTLGGEYAQGQAWVRLLGSTVAPMSLYSSSEQRDAWTKFWDEVIVPKGFGDTGYSEEQSDLIEHYLADNPGSLGFATFYSQRNEATKTLPFEEEQDDAFFDGYYTGEISTMEPEAFSMKLQASESRRFYQNQLSAKLHEISPNNDPFQILTEGFEKNGALQQYNDSWNRYKYLNPEAANILDEQSRLWRESKDIPTRSWEAERTANALTDLKAIMPMLSGEEGIRPEFVRRTMAEIQKVYSQNGEFGAPNTESEKAIGWWYDNVMQPYVDKTTGLYEQADRLTSLGQDASPIYDQIRALSNAPVPSYQGRDVPSVEEVFFGNKSPEEQRASVDAWTTRPIEWLSDFQREQVGWKISPTDAKFLDDYAGLQDLFYGYVNSKGLTSGSKDYARAEKQNQQLVQGMAAQAGPSALKLLQLTQAAPYERLAYQQFGSNSQGWADTVNLARLTTGYITGEKMSVKGFSADVAMPAKIFFYQSLNNARANDPALDKLLDDLSMSLPLPGGQYREGALLYEAVFFGNFRTTDIPDTLTSLGDGSPI